jgi:GMP synthase PP-ATPase subunit
LTESRGIREVVQFILVEAVREQSVFPALKTKVKVKFVVFVKVKRAQVQRSVKDYDRVVSVRYERTVNSCRIFTQELVADHSSFVASKLIQWLCPRWYLQQGTALRKGGNLCMKYECSDS